MHPSLALLSMITITRKMNLCTTDLANPSMETAQSVSLRWNPAKKSSGVRLLVVKTSTRLASSSGVEVRMVALLLVSTVAHRGKKMAHHNNLDLLLVALLVLRKLRPRLVITRTLATFQCIKLAIKRKLRHESPNLDSHEVWREQTQNVWSIWLGVTTGCLLATWCYDIAC